MATLRNLIFGVFGRFYCRMFIDEWTAGSISRVLDHSDQWFKVDDLPSLVALKRLEMYAGVYGKLPEEEALRILTPKESIFLSGLGELIKNGTIEVRVEPDKKSEVWQCTVWVRCEPEFTSKYWEMLQNLGKLTTQPKKPHLRVVE